MEEQKAGRWSVCFQFHIFFFILFILFFSHSFLAKNISSSSSFLQQPHNLWSPLPPFLGIPTPLWFCRYASIYLNQNIPLFRFFFFLYLVAEIPFSVGFVISLFLLNLSLNGNVGSLICLIFTWVLDFIGFSILVYGSCFFFFQLFSSGSS